MKKNSNYPWKRRTRSHAQLHLPPLTGDEALLVANVLQRMADAIWRAHGDAMGAAISGRDPGDETIDYAQSQAEATGCASHQFDIQF